MDENLALLRGGSRDGESTTVALGVTRLLAASDAPGMIDVYERTDEPGHVAGNTDAAVVFEFSGQEPIGELVPGMLHMPPRPGS